MLGKKHWNTWSQFTQGALKHFFSLPMASTFFPMPCVLPALGTAFASVSTIVLQIPLSDAFTAVDAHICHGNHITLVLRWTMPKLFA